MKQYKIKMPVCRIKIYPVRGTANLIYKFEGRIDGKLVKHSVLVNNFRSRQFHSETILELANTFMLAYLIEERIV